MTGATTKSAGSATRRVSIKCPYCGGGAFAPSPDDRLPDGLRVDLPAKVCQLEDALLLAVEAFLAGDPAFPCSCGKEVRLERVSGRRVLVYDTRKEIDRISNQETAGKVLAALRATAVEVSRDFHRVDFSLDTYFSGSTGDLVVSVAWSGGPAYKEVEVAFRQAIRNGDLPFYDSFAPRVNLLLRRGADTLNGNPKQATMGHPTEGSNTE